MKVLVTGATGFIGRRLVDRLVRDGDEVIALVRSEEHGLPDAVTVVHGDLMAPESLESVGVGCDLLFHLAAMITFDTAKRDQLVAVNGVGTANVLEAAQRLGIERSVVVSSACTLGLSVSPEITLDEDAPVVAKLAEANPYMAGKIAAESAAALASQTQDVVIVNPTTVYGPGDWSLNSGTLVKQVAGAGVMPVPPGGSNVVDVDDVVEGMLAAAEHGRSGRRYVLGGQNLLFSEIFSAIAEAVDHTPLWIRLPKLMRSPMAAAAWVAGRLTGSRFLTPQIVGDLFSFKYYSSDRAARELHWTPRYRFSESAERAWAFYKEHGLA
jgi:dihydroflavonol-4-reductase